ncbi:MAG: sulfatase-like hydrolase/transferase [Pirellulaceae bacterium]
MRLKFLSVIGVLSAIFAALVLLCNEIGTGNTQGVFSEEPVEQFSVFLPASTSQTVLPVKVPTRLATVRKQSSQRRNIIVINLDDADRDAVEIDWHRNTTTAAYFPSFKRLVNEGLRFGNCHVAVPLCNPSRVCLFTGQYAYKTGVRGNHSNSRKNSGAAGGFKPFRFTGPYGSNQNPHFNNEIGSWMKGSGYRTMFVGKYLHEDYEPEPGESWQTVVPPGWDDFYASFGGSYFTTPFFKNGQFSKANTSDPAKYPSLYRTDIESTDCIDLINAHLDRDDGSPFLLYFAPLACHQEVRTEMCIAEDIANCGMVANRLKTAWPNLKQLRKADFDEANVDDKPAQIRSLGRLTSEGTDPEINDYLLTDMEFRRRLLALKSVDLALGRMMATLSQRGIADDTVIILTSDNGFQLGQQRNFGKSLPYNRCTNVPLIVWSPTNFGNSNSELQHLISNIDIAPTLLDIAGAPIPEVVQGKSFLPILDGSFREPPETWRPDGVLVEGWSENTILESTIDANFTSIRFQNSVYTEWSNGDKEFYDLAVDPLQLENKYLEQSDSNKFHLANQLSALKRDLPAPLCFFRSPTQANRVFLGTARLEGIAESNGDIEDVLLQITEDTAEGIRFWNGSEWTETESSVEASIESNDSVITGWHYRFEPPLNSFRNYRVQATVAGANGGPQSQPVEESFSIDPDQPISQLIFPASDIARIGGRLNLRGWAQDDAGIRAVRLVIRNAETNKYWNGQDWQDAYILVGATLTPGVYVDWQYEFNPRKTNGSAYVTVRAISNDGRYDRPAQTKLIRWAR